MRPCSGTPSSRWLDGPTSMLKQRSGLSLSLSMPGEALKKNAAESGCACSESSVHVSEIQTRVAILYHPGPIRRIPEPQGWEPYPRRAASLSGDRSGMSSAMYGPWEQDPSRKGEGWCWVRTLRIDPGSSFVSWDLSDRILGFQREEISGSIVGDGKGDGGFERSTPRKTVRGQRSMRSMVLSSWDRMERWTSVERFIRVKSNSFTRGRAARRKEGDGDQERY